MLKKLLALALLGVMSVASLGAMKRSGQKSLKTTKEIQPPRKKVKRTRSEESFTAQSKTSADSNQDGLSDTISTLVSTAPTISSSLSSTTNNNSNIQSSSSSSTSTVNVIVVSVNQPWSPQSAANDGKVYLSDQIAIGNDGRFYCYDGGHKKEDKLTLASTSSTMSSSSSTTNNNSNIQSASSLLSSSSSSSTSKIVLGNRPLDVQGAVNAAFDKNKKATGNWRYDGAYEYYGIMDLDEEKILKSFASKGKNDIYIIDVGCARGGWARKIVHFLLHDNTLKSSGKHFHIFSITGGNECMGMPKWETFCKTSIDNVTLYEFNQFKIENIDEEFKSRGFDLIGKADLIVSHWTLRHLVDPFGTLVRMYRLLTPSQGLLLSNGFLFAFADSDNIETFPGMQHWNILDNANAISLFRHHDPGRDVGHFLLQRTNDKELEIPLEYIGEVRGIGADNQCESGFVTVFKKGLINHFKPFSFKENINDVRDKTDFLYAMTRDINYYCDEHNQDSKKLYFDLRSKGLFDWQ